MIIGCGRAIVRSALILFAAAQDSAVDAIGRVGVGVFSFSRRQRWLLTLRIRI
jgi:hypothetical protein